MIFISDIVLILLLLGGNIFHCEREVVLYTILGTQINMQFQMLITSNIDLGSLKAENLPMQSHRMDNFFFCFLKYTFICHLLNQGDDRKYTKFQN